MLAPASCLGSVVRRRAGGNLGGAHWSLRAEEMRLGGQGNWSLQGRVSWGEGCITRGRERGSEGLRERERENADTLWRSAEAPQVSFSSSTAENIWISQNFLEKQNQQEIDLDLNYQHRQDLTRQLLDLDSHQYRH